MDNKNRNNIGFLLVLSSFIVNFFIFSIVVVCKNAEYYPLFLLSLSYSAISIILFSAFKLYGQKKSVTIILSLFYLRMIIIPLLLVLFNKSNTMDIGLYFNHYVKSILLMCYEYICVLFTIMFCNKRETYQNKISLYEKGNINKQNFKLLYFIVFMFIIFFIFIVFKYPYAKYSFKFLFSTSSTSESIVNYKNTMLFKNSIHPVLYWGFSLVFQLLYILLPFMLIYIIKASKKTEKTKIFFSLVIIFVFCCITTEEKASSIFMAISLLFYLIELYPMYKKKVYKSIIGVGIIAVLGIFLKNNVTLGQKTDYVKMLQAYFSGPYYINTVFNMNNSYNFDKFIPDIMSSLAYIKYFFGNIITSNDLYNLAYYGNSVQQDKIMPMIAQSYYYFGFLLSPIISVFMTRMAIYMESKLNSKDETNQLKRFINIYLIVIFSTSIITYNFTIMISKITGTILPLILIYLFIDKFKLSLNNERK